ncbi:AraC family transcriptional regulator [Burkholderia pseudomultivorans]|nr:AraC family transcriptional regulator [Burkholderia pseudomultivorans]
MTPGAYRQFFMQHGHAPGGDTPALDTRPPSLERAPRK